MLRYPLISSNASLGGPIRRALGIALRIVEHAELFRLLVAVMADLHAGCKGTERGPSDGGDAANADLTSCWHHRFHDVAGQAQRLVPVTAMVPSAIPLPVSATPLNSVSRPPVFSSMFL